MLWWEKYMGKPWSAIPNPPESYTCGELVRAVMRERCGIIMPEVLANAAVLRECVAAMQPARYGLRPLRDDECPREYDVAFFIRASLQDHVGIGVDTPDGIVIMHCQQGVGVTWDTPAELLGTGYRRICWYRHTAFDQEDTKCLA